MKTRVSPSKAGYCAYCANGSHRLCTARAMDGRGECECGGRAHDPTVEVAAAMRRYVAPDRVGAPVEVLATEWRRVSG